MDLHREMMDKVLQSILKSKTSPVLKDDKYEAVINFLKHPSTCKDKHFRHWVKSKQLQMMDLPGLGIKDAVVVPGKGTKSSPFLRVIPESKIYDIMKEVHFKELQHSGYKKCRDYVSYIFEFLFALIASVCSER